MIRINTAPLGMQNLLSGNRKLYASEGGTTIKGCYIGWDNGDKRLLLNAYSRVSNTPAVIYKSETDSVVYCPISPRIIYENIDNRTHEISISEYGCNYGNYKKNYVIESGQTVEIDRLPWEQMKNCGLMAGNMSLGSDEYLIFRVYNDDTGELIEEKTLPKYGFIGIKLSQYGYINLRIEGFVKVINS